MALSPSQLAPGDVLLHKGRGLIPWAIRTFDNADVNHASLYIGDGQVTEALVKGLTTRSLAESVNSDTIWHRRLRNPPPTMKPVVAVARHYQAEGHRYGYEQIFLLAFLCLVRGLKVTPILDRLARGLLDKAAAVLASFTQLGKKPLICSEFVYRCYDEAEPGMHDPYTLRIGEAAYAPTVSPAVTELRATLAPPPPVRLEDPDSLLSLLRSQPAKFWLTDSLDEPSRQPRPEPSDQEIEELLLAYKQEVTATGPTSRLAPRSLDLDGLRLAAHGFAEGLQALILPKPMPMKTFAEGLDFFSSPEVTASFVTPGDLLRCSSLMTVEE